MLQRVGRGNKGTQLVQQALPCRGQTHTAFAAQKQIDAQLVLQGIHHLREPRLGIAQLSRGGCQTARLRRREKGVNFLAFHVNYFTFL